MIADKRLIRCSSRNKKQEHLDSLEATVARLQAENKDLASRLIEQNTRSIVHGGGGAGKCALPLSPDPSSIVDRERELGWGAEDGSGESDEEEDDEYSFPASSQRGVSSVPSSVPQSHTQQTSPSSALAHTLAPTESNQHVYNPPLVSTHTQAHALVSLSTENASLKERLAKLEKVVQLLLGMNAGGVAGPGIMGSMSAMGGTDQAGGDVLRLLGPDRINAVKGSEGGGLNPQPFVSQFNADGEVTGMNDNYHQHSPITANIHADIPQLVHQASLALPTSNQTSQHSQSPNLIFPTTENQDHARHPAAMTTTLSARDEHYHIRPRVARSALQRACFSPSLVLASKSKSMSMSVNKEGSREREERVEVEQEELRGKVLSGLKRVLEWRSACLGMGMMSEQQPASVDLGFSVRTPPAGISLTA